MKKTMKKMLLSVIVMGAAQLCLAQQNYVHKVIVLNEGQYDYVNEVQVTPVSIGAYDPVAGSYSDFDTISEMRWGSDVFVDGQNIYVAGDSLLLIYDKDSYQMVNSVVIQGIRKISPWNNKIIVTRKPGNYNAYFQVYEKSTLNLIYELDTINGPKYSTEGIAVYNDSAYVAVNNGFEWGNYKSILGIIDLNSQSYTGEVDFGPDGLNPDNVMIDGSEIYTLNNKNWDSTGSSITIYNTANRTHQTYNLAGSAGGCGASVSAASFIYYQRYNSTDTVSRFNKSSQISDGFAESIPGFVYGMVTDTINSLLYITATDYFSYGMAYIMQFDGTVIDSFAAGISPGNMALDVRTTTGIAENNAATNLFTHPNPFSDELHIGFIDEENEKATLILSDVLGQEVYQEQINTNVPNTLSLSTIPQGMYFLKVETTKKWQ